MFGRLEIGGWSVAGIVAALRLKLSRGEERSMNEVEASIKMGLVKMEVWRLCC